VSVRASNERHLAGAAQEDPAAVLYRSPQQPSIDGNTVDMDVERNRFARTPCITTPTFPFSNHQIKLMLAALQG